MTLGFFSPLPPAHTGVAEYSAALLGAMRNVEVNRDGDIHLYHLGNNQLHRAIYERAIAEPGIVVLHDAVLHHLLLGSLDERAYVDEFVYNYGAWHTELAARLWAGRAKSGAAIYFDYPMLRRVVERARLVIVHNGRAAVLARAHGAALVREIPHLFDPPEMPAGYEVVRLRESLGVRTGDTLFGVFGYLRETKRVAGILRAFARVRRETGRAKLLLAGEFVSRDLERSLRTLPEGVIRAGYLDSHDFVRYAAATDVCLSLRWPSAGETSGITVRFMGMGKCVFVTASPENATYPANACVRIDPGTAEEEMLAAFMIWVTANPETRREIGEHAAAHIREFHGLPRVAAEYWRAVRDALS